MAANSIFQTGYFDEPIPIWWLDWLPASVIMNEKQLQPEVATNESIVFFVKKAKDFRMKAI